MYKICFQELNQNNIPLSVISEESQFVGRSEDRLHLDDQAVFVQQDQPQLQQQQQPQNQQLLRQNHLSAEVTNGLQSNPELQPHPQCQEYYQHPHRLHQEQQEQPHRQHQEQLEQPHRQHQDHHRLQNYHSNILKEETTAPPSYQLACELNVPPPSYFYSSPRIQ